MNPDGNWMVQIELEQGYPYVVVVEASNARTAILKVLNTYDSGDSLNVTVTAKRVAP